jgi:hypothetical protein
MLGLHMVNLKGAIIGPRGVRYVAAMGYSSRGAMAYEFTTQLKKLRDEQKLEGPFVIDFSAYIDAVMPGPIAVYLSPKGIVLLQNTTLTTTKETVAPLAMTTDLDPGGRPTVNIDMTLVSAFIDHYNIDEHILVWRGIRTRLEARSWK